jgi:hypothetical protein
MQVSMSRRDSRQSELREGHDAKDLGATEGAGTGVSTTPFDDAAEGLPRRQLHPLREPRLAYVHSCDTSGS